MQHLKLLLRLGAPQHATPATPQSVFATHFPSTRPHRRATTVSQTRESPASKPFRPDSLHSEIPFRLPRVLSIPKALPALALARQRVAPATPPPQTAASLPLSRCLLALLKTRLQGAASGCLVWSGQCDLSAPEALWSLLRAAPLPGREASSSTVLGSSDVRCRV